MGIKANISSGTKWASPKAWSRPKTKIRYFIRAQGGGRWRWKTKGSVHTGAFNAVSCCVSSMQKYTIFNGTRKRRYGIKRSNAWTVLYCSKFNLIRRIIITVKGYVYRNVNFPDIDDVSSEDDNDDYDVYVDNRNNRRNQRRRRRY